MNTQEDEKRVRPAPKPRRAMAQGARQALAHSASVAVCAAVVEMGSRLAGAGRTLGERTLESVENAGQWLIEAITLNGRAGRQAKARNEAYRSDWNPKQQEHMAPTEQGHETANTARRARTALLRTRSNVGTGQPRRRELDAQSRKARRQVLRKHGMEGASRTQGAVRSARHEVLARHRLGQVKGPGKTLPMGRSTQGQVKIRQQAPEDERIREIHERTAAVAHCAIGTRNAARAKTLALEHRREQLAQMGKPAPDRTAATEQTTGPKGPERTGPPQPGIGI